MLLDNVFAMLIKKHLNKDALREQNPNNQFQVLSPEFLKFGYETTILEVFSSKDDDA